MSPTTDPTAAAAHCTWHKHREFGRTSQPSVMTNGLEQQAVNALEALQAQHTPALPQPSSGSADGRSPRSLHLHLSRISASQLSMFQQKFAFGFARCRKSRSQILTESFRCSSLPKVLKAGGDRLWLQY